MKPRVVGICLLMMLLVGYPQVNASDSYTDVNESNWYYEFVMELSSIGIINGFEDGSFKPNESVSVDAFIKMLMTAMGYKVHPSGEYWAQPYIDMSIELGIMDEHMFDDYRRAISRGEMALVAANALELKEGLVPFSHFAYQIEDFDRIAESEQQGVMIAMASGLMTGFEDYTFQSEELTTRAQAAVVITRFLESDQRASTNIFEEKIEQLETYQDMLLSDTSEDFKTIEKLLMKITDGDVTIKGVESTNVIINESQAWLESYMSQLSEGFVMDTVTPYQGEVIIGNVTWIKEVKDGQTTFKGVADNGDALFVDLGDGFEQVALWDAATGIRYEVERSTKGYIYYVEYFDGDQNQRVGYLISIEPDNKFQEIKRMDSERHVQAYTIYKSNRTIYVNEQLGIAYKYIDASYAETEWTRNENTEVYIQTNGTKIYSEVSDGSLNGNGYRKNVKGEVFMGKFLEGDFTGSGTMFFNNGIVLEGEFIGYVPTGQNSHYTGPDGNWYALSTYMEQVIDEVITKDMKTFDKVKAIHDYLVLRINYAEDTIENDLSDMDYNNAYTAIMDGSSVCLGYAQAMNQFMTMLDIESYIVIGDSDRDGRDDHAWNYIRNGLGYYHVDVTWDDPDNGDRIRYDYLMVSDSSIKKDRIITDILGYEK